MNLYRKLEDFPESLHGGALTIGNFDGVHRGHSQIIDRLRQHASDADGAAIVFTFDPHPVRLLRPDQAPPPLTWTNRKAELLSELGIDAMIAFPTNPKFLSLTSQEFFDQIIVQAIGAKVVVEGPNFFFGKQRQGTVETLKQMCDQNDILLEIVKPIQHEAEYISSSRIRGLVHDGHVGLAGQLLTRPYRIRGMVTHGAARGAKLGFPTANLDGIDTLIPKDGVYAGRVVIARRKHLAAINIGPNPTFGERAKKVEVHVINFNESIYGQTIEVDFIQRLRDIRQFESTESLVEQLKQDIADARQVASSKE